LPGEAVYKNALGAEYLYVVRVSRLSKSIQKEGKRK